MANMLSWLTGRENQAGQPSPVKYDDGQPSLRAYNPTPSERVGSWIQDLLMAGGAQAYPAGHVAHGVRDLLSMSPLGIGMSAADLLHAKSAGDPMGAAAAAIGMMPGLKPEVQAVRQGIRAYHGSPHDFEKFDISKIGSGEGAQSYGHGLYFAENEGVAKQYRDQLAKSDWQVNGKWLEELPDEQRKIAEQYIKTRDGAAVRGTSLEAAVFDKAPRGHTYEVNINAKPEQFLDWDKQLSQQSPDIQEGLRHAMGINYYGKYDPAKGKRVWDEFQHADASRTVKQGFIASDDKLVAQRLDQAGIPGIRYLDQGSRYSPLNIHTTLDDNKYWLAPQGQIKTFGPFNTVAEAKAAKQTEFEKQKTTSNYVLFNDQLVDIMRKYGLAAPAAAGAASYAMQSQEAQAGKAQAAQFQQPAPLSDRINQMIDSLQWGDQWQGRMRLPLERKVNTMLEESVWPPLR